jgi:hypothetical protein
MEQYIKKSALVAEIEKRIEEGEKVAKELPSSAIMGIIQAYKNTLSFIDTLEVKEVDLKNDSFADSKKHHRAIFIKELRHKVSEYEEVIKKSSDATKCDDVDWVTLASDMFDMLQKCLLKF